MKTTLKRIAAPKTWPILRKTGTFIARPRPKGHSLAFTMPVVVVLRDIMQLVKTSAQATRVMREHDVRVNGTRIYQTDMPVGFMDLLTIDKDAYTISITEKGVLSVEKTKDAQTTQRLTGKTHIRGGKVQLNFQSGMNAIINKDTYRVGDSLIVKDGKITGHLKFEKGANVIVTGGYHIGKKGKIEEIKGNVCTIKTGKESFPTTKENTYVI